jgi:tetratricopeptide (TPR) repeat protein
MGQVGNQFQSSDGRWHDSANEANDWNLQSKAGGSFDAGSAMSDSAFQAANVGAAVAGGIIIGGIAKAGQLQDEGIDLFKKGDLDGALKKLDAAISKSKMAAIVPLTLKGYIHYKKGENDKALAAYKKAESHAWREGDLYALRSELYAKIGDTEKATADCCDALNGCYEYAYNATQKSIKDYIRFFGIDMSGFEQRCFPLLKAAAERGNKYAYAGLAECYDQGYGTAKNEQEAMKWFAKSAEVGYLNGMAKTKKGGMFFRAILATYGHKIGGVVGGILGLLFFIVGAIPGYIIGRKYARTLLKKIWPGFSGMKAVKPE